VTSSIKSRLDRISQTIFVPKSYKTFRTISMEPATLQYTQQGVLREIDRVVSESRYLRNHIGTRDQTRNQRLAKEGSISRNYATIDLSAASDSVSYALVKKLFRGTKLLRFLVATRSPRTLLPDGRLIDLKKFAPMGSSLCFPVETLIFASICAFVTREHDVSGDFSVYGDDIIVPTQCVDDVMLILETLGFSVNTSKSFYDRDCWFRESCGAEYCDGFDVTPMRVSRKYASHLRDERIVSLNKLATRAYNRGYRNLRYFFLRKLRASKVTPLFNPQTLESDNYTNFHTKRRWNHDLQRIDCWVSTLQPTKPTEQDEAIRLRHWLEVTQSRESLEDGFVSRVDRPFVLIRDRWMSKPFEEHDQFFIDWFQRGGN
jgi:hypothetical protein